MLGVQCTNCRRAYPSEGAPYRCPVCGGVYDYQSPPRYDPQQVDPAQPGIFRYRQALGLPDEAPAISLGEGNTPLAPIELDGRSVWLKCEFQNPSGSFKDRGEAVLTSFLRARGVEEAVEDSSGNAGAAFAAYAGRAGMRARVFIPDSASGPKRAQISAYGAQVVRIMGPRSNAAEAVRRAAEDGAVYASHAYLPFNLPGYATLAYELFDQLGQAPGTIILPVGQGGLLLGIGRGFQALQSAGLIQHLPKMIGVQARACAPLWAMSMYGAAGLSWVAEAPTQAEGIRVRHPVRGDAVLQWVEGHGGLFHAVDEPRILEGRDELARRGFYVEATSAVVWGALKDLSQLPAKKLGSDPSGEKAVVVDPVVAILTGSGLKNNVG